MRNSINLAIVLTLLGACSKEIPPPVEVCSATVVTARLTKEYGGQAASFMEQMIFAEESALVGAPEINGGDYPATVSTPFTSLAAPPDINRGQAVAESVTFRLTATVDGVSKTKDVTLTYQNERMYGVSTNAAINTDGEIDTFRALAGTAKGLWNARQITFSVTAGVGEYIYYIIRNAWGTPTFTVGGFEGGFQLVGDDVAYTNPRSFSDTYDVWRSDNSGLGATTVVVT